jgi:hypothetical protein
MNDAILIKKDIITKESSTIALHKIKEAVMMIALSEGKGIKLEINCINNNERQNCKVKYTVELE